MRKILALINATNTRIGKMVSILSLVVAFIIAYEIIMHVAYLSPPFAPSAFYTKSITPPEITMTQIYKAILPYLYWTLLATAIVTAWPGLSLWLPKLLLRH